MNTKVEAQGGELVLRNTHGDVVIIPRNKRREALGYLAKGDHRSIDAIAMKLPKASDYAMSGGVYDGGEDPNDKIVKVNQNNEVKEYNTSSQEYRDLYNTGKLMNYDKNTDTYIAAPLKEVNITAEAPQWIKDKRKYESQYSKDWYIDNKMPKFSRAMGVSSDNMHPNSVKEYNNYINNKVVEDIFKRKPTFDNDYSNDRLKTLQEFSQKELELIKNSSYASKIEPSIWSKFEQGLLSVGNVGSPVQFKNPSLSQEEAKKEDNPLNILQPLNIPSKMVQSTYKDNYSFKDALKGKQNNANIVEDIVTDPLNLIGLGIWGKLSKANNFAKLEDAYQAIKTLDKTTLEKQIGTTLSNDDWQYLYRVQEKGFDIEKPTLKAIEERVASGKGKWYDNNILNNPELRANMESRDRYYGQWFEQDPKRLDYYLADKENIEILRAKVPKEILEQYRIDNFDPEIAKKWSLSHETEYIIPKDLIQKAEKFKRNDWQKLIDEHEAIKSKVLNKLDDAVNNINRIKFDDFKNDNEFFRVIVGDEAFDDIVQTQKIRTKQPSSVKNTPPNTINLDRRGSTAFPSFSKGSPSLSYANDNPNHYIIRTADESIKPSTSGRHGKGTTMFPTDKSGKHLTELDASKVQVYKHVGNGEYELVNTAKPIISSVDDVVKNLPKLEQIPLDFKIEDVLKNISSTERKNMEIVKKGNAYFKELDNPESLKRLKEFGDEYGIDLLDAYKKAEQRWDYGNNIGKNDRFQVKKTDEDWYGLSTTNWDYEDELRLFDVKQKFGEDSKQVKDFYKDISQKKSISYISDVVPLGRYEKTIWHELSHDINKSIIDSSPKLQEDIKNIFTKKGAADINKVKKAREYVADDFYTKKDKILKDLDNPEKLKEIGEEEFDYVTRPTETWAFLSTNLRQDLKNTGIIKNYNELLTPEKLEQAIKNNNTVFSRFEPYIKDKEAFIKLFNKMTLSIAPAALYLQSQNQNKLEQ